MRRLLALLVLGTTFSCSNSDPVGPIDGRVQIRIANETTSLFTSVEVLFPSDEVDYGALPAGARSEYRSVSVAYRFARVDVRIGETEHVLQPIDYMGEEPLEPGQYTYRLYFHEQFLQLEAIRD